MMEKAASFQLLEATIGEIKVALAATRLTALELTQLYLRRIEAFDASGSSINSIITINPDALEAAEALDKAFRASGPVGPLHGVPLILKDQIDAVGMPTTLGSVLFRDYFPKRDAFVVEKLKQAGAVILAKATLGELGQGDAHGSLFGSTKNPYDLERTVGGSSGGPAAAAAANFGAGSIGQEALASIRRPAAWNSVVGMRPTAGLISRSGVYAGWPATAGSLGPLTRTVDDQAVLLDVMVGYDREDPLTGLGFRRAPRSFTDFLDPEGLNGRRIGVLREPIGLASEPDSEDFHKVSAVFDRAVRELEQCGALVVDPVSIPDLRALLERRGTGGGTASSQENGWNVYFSRGNNPPFASREEMLQSPEYSKVHRGPVLGAPSTAHGSNDYLSARQELLINVLSLMAELNLDAIVHKSAEHQPTLISEGVRPPFVNGKGATHLNTFLTYVPAISVPAGFTSDGLPVGITFMGRPYDDGLMLSLAFAYERATHHRQPPASTPRLDREP